MTGQDGLRCPRCGVPRAPGTAPECDCARHTADAAHRTRRAEAAAAEDFDPLRIRPYVSLPDPDAGATNRDPAPAPPAPRPASAPGPGRSGGAAATGAKTPPDQAADGTAAYAPTPHTRRARTRRYLLLGGGAGAVALVVGGVVFASGLFSSAGDRPERGRALPGGAPASASAGPAEPAPPTVKPSASATRTPSTAPRRAAAPPAPTRSTAPPSSSPSSRPSSPPSTARATGSVGAEPSRTPPGPSAPAVLREGDEGPAVAELQGRLAQLHLYTGERDGTYSRAVTVAVLRYQWARDLTSDPPGAYGRQTRRSLESETEEP